MTEIRISFHNLMESRGLTGKELGGTFQEVTKFLISIGLIMLLTRAYLSTASNESARFHSFNSLKTDWDRSKRSQVLPVPLFY